MATHSGAYAQVYRDWTMPFPDEPPHRMWFFNVLEPHPQQPWNIAVRRTGAAERWEDALADALMAVDYFREQAGDGTRVRPPRHLSLPGD